MQKKRQRDFFGFPRRLCSGYLAQTANKHTFDKHIISTQKTAAKPPQAIIMAQTQPTATHGQQATATQGQATGRK